MKKQVKIIFHIDMNAFFIACELIRHPELKNIPLAVGSSAAIFNKGVILSASYEARKFGVKSAMSVFEARQLCPELKIIPGDHDYYEEISQKFINFLHKYTDIIEVASIDEAYLDMTEVCQKRHAIEVAKEIQETLLKEYQLPCSIGISINKFLAKMASDMKKPLGITVIRKRELSEKLWPLAIDKMYGIGNKTAPRLYNAGIKTIGDLVKPENKPLIKSILGNLTDHFIQAALGNSDDTVNPNRNSEYKSIGNSTTFIHNLHTAEEAYTELQKLAKLVTERLHAHNYVGKTITVTIKYPNLSSYSKSRTINEYTNNFELIYQESCELFDKLWKHEHIRLLGISVKELKEKQQVHEQLSLFNYQNYVEEERLIRLVNDLKRKYGDKVIKKGMRDK